ncbi:stromal membrane-associated protein 2-like isoform X2 [Gigantopelta aegis]|uniref:stromal membrane-associated protein 2-like isoform X2 n=1 Tax=Gigantopelta aegis TaxID=1735272 RepID=UPI001B887672|nr:stromal membrane-associated protein 2-like isoform X2 [Gigantopelta aegis]
MSKVEKDRVKAQQEKFQAILSNLLKDDDNKYCVDCDAKGPRWASWNLGVFLCIRCAGIHRKMGVHVSKVKSVNLDSWNAEQVAMMQEVGNSRARAAYEAELPNNFRRPQTDSALENFIRTKYEHKKYLAREWIQPKPVVPKEIPNEWLEDDRDKKRKSKPASTMQLNSASAGVKPKTMPAEKKPTEDIPAKPKPQPAPPKPSAAADLIGLDFGFVAFNASSNNGQANGGDLLADIFGNSDPNSVQLLGGGSNQSQPVQNGDMGTNLFENSSSDSKGSEKNTKDSILALYGNSTSQQQMFGVPVTNSEPSISENLLVHPSTLAYQAPLQQQQQQQQQQPLLFNMQQCQPGSPFGIGHPGFCFIDPGGMYMPQQNMYGMVPGQAGQPMIGGQPGMPGMMPQQQGMMPQQQGMMRMQQPNAYGMGQVGGIPGGMMSQPNMMMPPQGSAFNPQQQQMQQQIQYQQMQQQMAAMKLAGGQMAGTVGMAPVMGSQGGQNWMPASTGQTLSNNLWQ